MESIQVNIRPAVLDDSVRSELAVLSTPKCDTTGGLQSVDDKLDGACLFEVEHAGHVILRYGLRVNEWAHGREGVIIGAVGAAPFAMTARLLPAIESQFLDVRAVTIYTKRRGLVRELARQGYRIDGFILHKCITKHQC